MSGERLKNPTSIVVIEAPYSGDIEKHLEYLDECIRDCFERGEAPLASRLMYASALDDLDPFEEGAAISAGCLWAEKAPKRAVYVDHGISAGMHIGIEEAQRLGQEIVYRDLYVYDESLRSWRRRPISVETKVST